MNSPNGVPLLGIIVITIPLVIYIIGALSVARRDIKHPDDFFIAYRKVGVTAFSSSSIAYAFQVSTIYPFLLWGASNFYFVPAVNTICWGLGIFLFYLCFDRYKQFIGRDVTLHGFLGEYYGASVRRVASYLTIIGFLGFAIAETYFGSKVLLSVIENKNVFYFVVGAALIFVMGYISYGGQWSSIRTDQLQLVISYVGVFGIMLYFIYLLIARGVNIPGMLSIGFLILIVYIPLLLMNRRFSFIRFSESDSAANRLLNGTLNVLITALLIGVLALGVFELNQSGWNFQVSKIVNLEGFGVPGLLSLIILPLCWQFVDLTNWQRLLAVKAQASGDVRALHSSIRKGLLIYAVESPFTWMIFLFFGLLAVSALPAFTIKDLLIDIPHQMIVSGSAIDRLLGYTFIISVIAIMLSTVDSFLIGMIFTFVYDSFGSSRRLIDSGNAQELAARLRKITGAGKAFGFIAVLLGIALFITFDRVIPSGGELFINLLLAFYSAQLSFFPLVLAILFLKIKPTAMWANASMVGGAVAGIALGIYGVVWNPSLAWYPILSCTSVSIVVFFLGVVSRNKSMVSS